jgi:type IV secretory pathway TrbF-like protein
MSTHSMQVTLNRSIPIPEEGVVGSHLERSALYQVHNRWLRLALLVCCCVMGLMSLAGYRMARALATTRPLVIRVNELGQPSASTDDAMHYQPREAELKHFLINFVVDHYSRIRTTRRDAFRRELYFLDAAHARAVVEEETRVKAIQAFLTGNDDEVEIRILNVAIEDLRTAPYKATVNFERVFRSSADQRESRRERSVAHLVCTVMPAIPNNFIPVNPLGLVVTYFREDQAF